jgi:hypothetical protein
MSKEKTTRKSEAGGTTGASHQRALATGATAGVDDAGVSVGLDHYLGHIAHLDMPLEVKIDLIRALHEMMRSFVDRAFGEDPVQLAAKHTEIQNNSDTATKPPMLRSDLDINSNPRNITGGFRRNADPRQEKATDQ